MEHLISKEYQEQITKYHKSKNWGGAIRNKAADVHKYCVLSGAKSVLDYGAGSGDLLDTLKGYGYELDYQVHEYEPGVPEKAGDPPVCDFLVCCDVLEHVEPDKIDGVLKHMYDKTNKFAFIHLSTQPAMGAFPGGGNLHLLVKPGQWWVEQLGKYWEFIELVITRGNVICLCKKV